MRKTSITLSVLLSVVLLLPFSGCKKKSRAESIPPFVFWDQLQTSIAPADGSTNSWNGFVIKGDVFVTDKPISRFSLWRKRGGKIKATLQYRLKGVPADMLVNSREAVKLLPIPEWGKQTLEISTVKGFNLIEFHTINNSVLMIKAIEMERGEKDEFHHLKTGESFSCFFPAGAGVIGLSGEGKVRFRWVEMTDGKKNVKEAEMEPSSFSDEARYPFGFNTFGTVTVSAESGTFDITTFDYLKKMEKSSAPQGEQAERKEFESYMKSKPGIHILVIDGCQAAHLGIYGYSRDTSPNIDRLAQDGIVFDNAYTSATVTTASVTSIFTGWHPPRHKLNAVSQRLNDNLFMLHEFMRLQGYKTAILTEAGNLSDYLGFKRGVDVYKKIVRRWDDPRFVGNNMYTHFSQWLENREPLFTYVHFRPPHFPILPPPPYLDMFSQRKQEKKKAGNAGEPRMMLRLTQLIKEGYSFSPSEVSEIIDDYDSAVRYVDFRVGELVDKLKAVGQYDTSLIIFTSDHGEACYEHQCWGHSVNVYPETARVPLIVKFPAEFHLSGRVERVTQLVDIFPTIAALFGDKGKKRIFDGCDIVDSLDNPGEDDTFAFSTSTEIPPSIGIRWRSWYYIIHMSSGKEELFNLKQDLSRDVAKLEENRDLLVFFKTKFLHWYNGFADVDRLSQSVDLKKLPKEDYDELKSLGYID
jgi:arylsulfatase A-like enzyme